MLLFFLKKEEDCHGAYLSQRMLFPVKRCLANGSFTKLTFVVRHTICAHKGIKDTLTMYSCQASDAQIPLDSECYFYSDDLGKKMARHHMPVCVHFIFPPHPGLYLAMPYVSGQTEPDPNPTKQWRRERFKLTLPFSAFMKPCHGYLMTHQPFPAPLLGINLINSCSQNSEWICNLRLGVRTHVATKQ